MKPDTNMNAELSPEEVMAQVSTGKPYVVLLLVAAAPPPADPEETGRLQMAHLQYLFRLHAEGKTSIFGPMTTDERLRGLIIFNTADKEEVRAWMADDPWIRGGYLSYELYDYFTLPGLSIPK